MPRKNQQKPLSIQKRKRAEKVAAGAGSISADRSYNLAAFMTLTGLGPHTLRSMERRGLVIVGTRGTDRQIHGSEWLRFMAAETERVRQERQSELSAS